MDSSYLGNDVEVGKALARSATIEVSLDIKDLTQDAGDVPLVPANI